MEESPFHRLRSKNQSNLEKIRYRAKNGLPCWNCPSTLIFIGNTTAHIVRNTLVFLILAALCEKLQPETSAEPVFFHCVEKFDRRFFFPSFARRASQRSSPEYLSPNAQRTAGGKLRHCIVFKYFSYTNYTIVYLLIYHMHSCMYIV